MSNIYPAAADSQDTPPGQIVFASLRAEEEPWLETCFVSPPDLEQIAEGRSTVIFGGPGSGKTALYYHLRNRLLNAAGRPNWLVANWSPSPLQAETSRGLAAVQIQIQQIFEACVEAILDYIANYPDSFASASELSRELLVWFMHRFSQTDLNTRIHQLLAGTRPLDPSIADTLLTAPKRDLLYPQANPDQVAAHLVKGLNNLGLRGVWIMGDGLEMWAEVAPEELVAHLNLFLSTLSLFERANFHYKLFLPARLEKTLAQASGLVRRRVDSYYLLWNPVTLRQLVEKRLRVATGQIDFTLADLCRCFPDLLDWLNRVGADSPREWLEQVKPLVEHYLAASPPQPIEAETWRDLRHKYPPRLYFDDAGKRVTVGARQISLEKLPAKAYNMLRYLCQQPGNRVVSKAELYFLAYRELDHVPRSPEDENYEARKEYEGVIDTNLWRLRKAIEPDPAEPVLLVTVRGHGIQLKTRW